MASKSDLHSLLRRAETDAELTAAVVRLVIFLGLGFTVLAASPGTLAIAALTAYGVTTGLGLVLAWRRVFHPAIPYIFVTFDVVLIAAQVLLLARLIGMHAGSAFALPATALIFVILAHAALRYRPWLVVYGAVLFTVSLELGPQLLPPGQSAAMGQMGGMGAGEADAIAHQEMMRLLNYRALPLTEIALASFILFVLGRRTRNLLLASIQEAGRTARLSRYFSPNLAARLAEGDDAEVLAGRRQPVAVLFVDIRGFTALGEAMAPEELGAFLTEFRERLTAPVFALGGTVDKFIGDAIMAVFGSPIQQPDDAARAVDCALDILQAVKQWSAERKEAGRPPVEIGIGGHYGEVFAGALGGEQLLEFTVIGDTVNVAERLERLSREVDSPVVLSAALLGAANRLQDREIWAQLPPSELRGHRQPVVAFRLVQAGSYPT
ncbi:MAG: adenylate/guanylate cyclase domain-containing protein [Tistlia sp.]